jgi:hypothetical protein
VGLLYCNSRARWGRRVTTWTYALWDLSVGSIVVVVYHLELMQAAA